MLGKKVQGIERGTFVVDAKGVLVKEWRGVKVSGRADEVLGFARTLCRAVSFSPQLLPSVHPPDHQSLYSRGAGATMGPTLSANRNRNRRRQGGSWSSARPAPRP